MKVKIVVNKSTFERILSGEQTKVYVPYNDRWTRKLTVYNTTRFRCIESVILVTGGSDPQTLIKAECLYVGSHTADPRFWPREERVYYFALGRFGLLHAPFPLSLYKESVRNRIK